MTAAPTAAAPTAAAATAAAATATALSEVRPRYGRASLADVMPSVLAVLGVPGADDRLGLEPELDGVRRIAVLLVDGLGWHQLPLAAAHAPTLADLHTGRAGRALELTTGFPSTTPTSLVSLGTGAAPGSHGILGFRLNVPGTARVLNHIDWRADPDPAVWQPVETQLERAAAAGVAVTAVSRPEFAGSGLTVASSRGGMFVGASDADQLAESMLTALNLDDAPALVSGYHPELDKVGHLHGVDTQPWREAAARVDRLVSRLGAGLPRDAALLVTADHGQLNVPADHRFDLDTDLRLREGVRVVAGEPRVRYLHVRPGAQDDVIAAWRAILGEAAWVVSREEAVTAGWFGPVPEAHLDRVGDVVAACRGRYAVLATKTDNPIEGSLVAYHGSWTAAEMMIPLLLIRG
jgi:hypothetical protein